MKPPLFFPGKKLKASDLIDLEEYLLSRNTILAPDHGVVKLYEGDKGPNQQQDRLDSLFSLDEVVGITPSGRPVQFKANAENLALQFRFKTLDNKPLLYDIYVTDIHQKPEDEKMENNQKYQLSCEMINDEEKRPILKSDRLYIGRYRLQNSTLPELIHPPLPYQLSSIRYPSEWWNQWTLPIRKALRKIAENYSDNQLIIALLSEFAFHYMDWPLSQLIRKSYQLKFLTSNPDPKIFLDEGAMQELNKISTVSMDWDPWQGKLPYELPVVITNIFSNVDPRRWQFLSELEYTKANNVITINRNFQSAHEIKIQFKEEIDMTNRGAFRINDQGILLAQAFSGEDIFNRPCWFYIIEYNNPGNTILRIKLPSNLPNNLSIYYRAAI